MKNLLLILIAACSMTSCNKRPDVETVSTYSFVNTIKSRITFDLYGSQDDYNNNRNMVGKYYIEENGTLSLPLERLQTYWVDWYSADHSFNNWRNKDYISYISDNLNPLPQIKIAAGDDTYLISSEVRDTTKSVMLNGNGAFSVWKCVITNANGLNGTHQFVFRKDFSGTYQFTNENGLTKSEQITYTCTNLFSYSYSNVAADFHVDVMDDNAQTFCRLYFIPHINPSLTNRDTMTLNFLNPSSNQSFTAARQ